MSMDPLEVKHELISADEEDGGLLGDAVALVKAEVKVDPDEIKTENEDFSGDPFFTSEPVQLGSDPLKMEAEDV